MYFPKAESSTGNSLLPRRAAHESCALLIMQEVGLLSANITTLDEIAANVEKLETLRAGVDAGRRNTTTTAVVRHSLVRL